VRAITHRIGALVAAVLLLAAGAPEASRADGPTAVFVAVPASPAAVSSRDLPFYRLGYLESIKFVDDGMRYVDPLSRFFVSPAGELCFRTVPSSPQIIYDSGYRDWCMHPLFVGRVETVVNDITNINEVRLSCRRDYPQCARRLGPPTLLVDTAWIANSISAATIDNRRERAALENLIALLGGTVVRSEPVGLVATGAAR
jgi:hypothetical protein